MEDSKQAIARTIAALVAAVGAYFICNIAVAIFKHFLPPSNAFDYFFLFVFPLPIFIAIGGYCIYSGYRLWLKISPENTRRISFVSSVIFFFFFLPVFRFLFKSEEIAIFLAPLLMIPAGIFFYFFNRLLLSLFNLPTATDWAQREKSVKRFFSWFVFLSLSMISFLISRVFPEILNSAEFLLCMVCSVVAAYCVYKFGVKIALRNKPKESEIPPYPSTSC
jgi:hypothetical protein